VHTGRFWKKASDPPPDQDLAEAVKKSGTDPDAAMAELSCRVRQIQRALTCSKNLLLTAMAGRDPPAAMFPCNLRPSERIMRASMDRFHPTHRSINGSRLYCRHRCPPTSSSGAATQHLTMASRFLRFGRMLLGILNLLGQKNRLPQYRGGHITGRSGLGQCRPSTAASSTFCDTGCCCSS